MRDDEDAIIPIHNPSAVYGPAGGDTPQILISSEPASADISQAQMKLDSHEEHQSETVILVQYNDVTLSLVLTQLEEVRMHGLGTRLHSTALLIAYACSC